jgi:hypothetical protein
MLSWALLASGQINMRKVDGWRTLAAKLKIAVLFYNTLRHGMGYTDAVASYYEDRYRQRVLANLERRGKSLGYAQLLIDTIPRSFALARSFFSPVDVPNAATVRPGHLSNDQHHETKGPNIFPRTVNMARPAGGPASALAKFPAPIYQPCVATRLGCSATRRSSASAPPREGRRSVGSGWRRRR